LNREAIINLNRNNNKIGDSIVLVVTGIVIHLQDKWKDRNQLNHVNLKTVVVGVVEMATMNNMVAVVDAEEEAKINFSMKLMEDPSGSSLFYRYK
jgi:hypothetical protein